MAEDCSVVRRAYVPHHSVDPCERARLTAQREADFGLVHAVEAPPGQTLDQGLTDALEAEDKTRLAAASAKATSLVNSGEPSKVAAGTARAFLPMSLSPVVTAAAVPARDVCNHPGVSCPVVLTSNDAMWVLASLKMRSEAADDTARILALCLERSAFLLECLAAL